MMYSDEVEIELDNNDIGNLFEILIDGKRVYSRDGDDDFDYDQMMRIEEQIKGDANRRDRKRYNPSSVYVNQFGQPTISPWRDSNYKIPKVP